ncbi:MAG: ammonia-forming cytochrome c nitrite reductase subunit c552 [Coriobacteriales bacterium]|nr:ammonia-forming cytochrome c nitrite reductase subunit c552 [Coriobacteriales bacterium]
MKRRKRAVAVATVAFLVFLTGCATFSVDTAERVADTTGQAGEAASSGLSASLRYNAEFKDVYPNEYRSFIEGALLMEEDGTAHSHANLRNRVEQDPQLLEVGAPCLSCKTAEFNELYATYGREVFTLPYAQVTGEVGDYFSCLTCHASGIPAEGADASLVTYTTYASEFLTTVDPQTAACGQCHNATCDYPRKLLPLQENARLEDFNPYRYGSDADALRRAVREDGMTMYPDEELGITVDYLGHPDIELFQGSQHQEQGLTCVSCHMPYETNEQGEQYRTHNASGSPLNNEQAMRYCLSCHASLGVGSTNEMRQFVRARQSALGAQEAEVLDGLDRLKARIVEAEAGGATDPATLRQAKEYYADASYYYSFQHAGADIPGGKVAHASARMYRYLEQSLSLIKEANALLQA